MKLLLLFVAVCALVLPIQGGSSNKLCFDQSDRPRRGRQTVEVIPKWSSGINLKSVLKNNLAHVTDGDCGDNKRIGHRVWLVEKTYHKCMKVQDNTSAAYNAYKYFDIEFDRMIKPLITHHDLLDPKSVFNQNRFWRQDTSPKSTAHQVSPLCDNCCADRRNYRR